MDHPRTSHERIGRAMKICATTARREHVLREIGAKHAWWSDLESILEHAADAPHDIAPQATVDAHQGELPNDNGSVARQRRDVDGSHDRA